jgi:site-specific DNA recombinase
LEGVERDFAGKLKSSVLLLKCFYKKYSEVDFDAKRKIIGSIFPQKLLIYKNTFRTSNPNSVISLICKLGKV